MVSIYIHVFEDSGLASRWVDSPSSVATPWVVPIHRVLISPQTLRLILRDGKVSTPKHFFPISVNLFPRLPDVRLVAGLGDEEFVSV